MRTPDPLYVLVWCGLTIFLLLVFWWMVHQLQGTLRELRQSMQDQVEAVRMASAAQNLIDLIEFVEDPKTRAARRLVIEHLTEKNEIDCGDKEREAAFWVCATYDVAGILIRNKLVPASPFLMNWGGSVVKCHKALERFIDGLGPERWDDFSWLRREVESSLDNAHLASPLVSSTGQPELLPKKS
jgi:hypothetical protein